MSLDSYHKKRDFNKTPEPQGSVLATKENLFIIQKHAASHLHYDFRLELNGVLKSWAVPKGPCLDPKVKRLAVHVEDHPLEYGLFEGIIPKGEYGGGTVILWDQGQWQSLDEDAEKAYQKGHLRFVLTAEKLQGRWDLLRFNKEDEKSWFLIKYADEFAKSFPEYDIACEKPDSVLSQLSLEEVSKHYERIWDKKNIAAKKKTIILPVGLKESEFPASISPQLTTLVAKPPEGEEWLHEIKFDGYRIIAFKDGKSVKLMSRNKIEWSESFKNIVQALKKLPLKRVVFDGEIVVLDEKHHSNFQWLQNSLKTNNETFIYYIFDLLYYDKFLLTTLPLLERKKILQQLLPVGHAILRYSAHILGAGSEIFTNACKLGLEGVVSKNIASPYMQKRSKSWLKVKCVNRQEFVIGGYIKPQGKRNYFGSLLLGFFCKDKLIYCGKVGTGFTDESLRQIFAQLQQEEREENPFSTMPSGVKNAIWVNPILVAEVEFSQWTSDGKLRHPSFKGLGMDKKASAVKREQAMHRIPTEAPSVITKTQRLTNPERILYPEDGFSKQDLFNYYNDISSFILPYIRNRPLSLVRCPENYKQCFYQKHLKAKVKALYAIPIVDKTKETEDYIYLKDKAGLLSLVQMGVLEIHPWGCVIDDIEHPDMITLDLDPGPGVTWQKVVAAAFVVKNYLAELKLQSFVKTTGGKGLHVVFPIEPEYSWEEIKNFTQIFVESLQKAHPQSYVSEMAKIKRQGKIFVDYLRNQRGATAVSAYSSRARLHASVATPLHWDELTHDYKDTYYTIQSLPLRLKKLPSDPWENFFKIKQSLNLNSF